MLAKTIKDHWVLDGNKPSIKQTSWESGEQAIYMFYGMVAKLYPGVILGMALLLQPSLIADFVVGTVGSKQTWTSTVPLACLPHVHVCATCMSVPLAVCTPAYSVVAHWLQALLLWRETNPATIEDYVHRLLYFVKFMASPTCPLSVETEWAIQVQKWMTVSMEHKRCMEYNVAYGIQCCMLIFVRGGCPRRLLVGLARVNPLAASLSRVQENVQRVANREAKQYKLLMSRTGGSTKCLAFC